MLQFVGRLGLQASHKEAEGFRALEYADLVLLPVLLGSPRMEGEVARGVASRPTEEGLGTGRMEGEERRDVVHVVPHDELTRLL